MVGYATAYTMLPVFSLVLDRDVNEDVALLYPELYKELTKVCRLDSKSTFPIDPDFLLLSGSISIVQNILHLVYHQCLSRRCYYDSITSSF